jgi:cytoplasmic iron level regulating protein YaaA (DUF328/UPF0246 family)
MGSTVYLVSCVSAKAAAPSPAKSLYVSAWFQKARKFVEARSQPWYILSAKYGLVRPDDLIAPYEQTLNAMGITDRRTWARNVTAALQNVLQPGDRAIFLAGMRYREFVVPALVQRGVHAEVPMEGLAIGRQLQWLDEH